MSKRRNSGLRVAHVVTYVSNDGAFGGPIAVARAQAEEMASRGHDVDFLGGTDRKSGLAVPGVSVRLHRTFRLGRGLSTLISPGLGVRLLLSRRKYDVLHIHAGRDLTTTLATLIARFSTATLILQPHGMIMPDRRIRARALDRLVVRANIKAADRVLALTRIEADGLRQVARGDIRLTRIRNGVRSHHFRDATDRGDAPIVLFLARLHPRKRVMHFAQAALDLRKSHPATRFRVVGPDEGDLNQLNKFILENELQDVLTYAGPATPQQSFEEFSAASIFVLPSTGEVFPMSVLEAMACGTPVVLTADCAIAPELIERSAIASYDPSEASLSTLIAGLLDDPAERTRLSTAGADTIREWLSIAKVVDDLEAVYREH